MTQLGTFTVKSATTVRDDVLRVIKNGLIRRGVASPNVGPTTDWYLLATAIGNELAVVGANCIISNEQQMPDTATLEGLQRIADLFDLEKQPAGGSVGAIIMNSSAPSPVATDAELTDNLGQRFKVTVGNTYATGTTIPIEAISVGAQTNHAAGDVLRWASAPPYADDKALVATGGLTNGIDAEDDEALRTRVLSLLQTPSGSGNWEQCAEICEASDPRVQKSMVHPAVQGPSTVDIVALAAPTSTNKSRVVSPTVMTGVVAPYVKGKLAEHANITITSAEDVNADVAFGLSIPDALTANPPGVGGGWLNGTPWPTPDGTTTYRCTVTAVTSTTVFTVDAAGEPIAGVSKIAWLSPYDWKLYHGLVSSFTGTSGAYVITIDRPFVGIVTGCYIWPDSTNAALYVSAILAAFALMGSGEKTANAAALIRGFRHPPPSTSWPSALGPHLQRAITNAQEEVLAVQFLHRTYQGNLSPATLGNGGQVVPPVPALIASAPRIFVPRHLGFYRIPS